MLASCASVPLPNVRVHTEIPFQDAPEAAYIETVSKETGIVPPKEWKEKRKYMLQIHIDDWAKLKKSLLKLCRVSDKKCKNQIESIDGSIRKLDEIIKRIFG